MPLLIAPANCNSVYFLMPDICFLLANQHIKSNRLRWGSHKAAPIEIRLHPFSLFLFIAVRSSLLIEENIQVRLNRRTISKNVWDQWFDIKQNTVQASEQNSPMNEQTWKSIDPGHGSFRINSKPRWFPCWPQQETQPFWALFTRPRAPGPRGPLVLNAGYIPRCASLVCENVHRHSEDSPPIPCDSVARTALAVLPADILMFINADFNHSDSHNNHNNNNKVHDE